MDQKPSSSVSYRDGVSDADIEAHSRAIRDDVERTQALVSDVEPPSNLTAEYADNPVFIPKIAVSNCFRLDCEHRCVFKTSVIFCPYRSCLASIAPYDAPEATGRASIGRLWSP